MNIAVCEDKSADASHLIQLIKRYCTVHQLDAGIDWFCSGKSLLKEYRPRHYQIVFLDIYMDGPDGIQTAERIRAVDEEVALILTTVSLEHGIASYSIDANYYIVKPVKMQLLEQAMRRCRQLLNNYGRYIEVLENRQPVRVILRDIRYIEAVLRTCQIHLLYRQVDTHTPLHVLEARLEAPPFLRCHRSYIVNLNRVRNLSGSGFLLDNRQMIPVSRSYRSAVQSKFMDYCIERARKMCEDDLIIR